MVSLSRATPAPEASLSSLFLSEGMVYWRKYRLLADRSPGSDIVAKLVAAVNGEPSPRVKAAITKTGLSKLSSPHLTEQITQGPQAALLLALYGSSCRRSEQAVHAPSIPFKAGETSRDGHLRHEQTSRITSSSCSALCRAGDPAEPQATPRHLSLFSCPPCAARDGMETWESKSCTCTSSTALCSLSHSSSSQL